MRKGITYEEVENAAKALTKKGANPTIERVRHFLGTGSAGTVNRYLNQYRENIKVGSPKNNKNYRQGYNDGIRDILRGINKLKG